MFIIHSATLLYHLPYLVRCEPRGSQIRFKRKTFEELRDSLSDRLFCPAYHMSKSSFENVFHVEMH